MPTSATPTPPSARAVYLPDGDGRFVPTALAAGPWDPGAQHGGAPGALLARELERTGPSGEMTLARLAFDFPRPAPLEPLELRAATERAGRRVRVETATLEAAGREVCRASATWVRSVPEDVSPVEPRAAPAPPGPRDAPTTHAPGPDRAGFNRDAVELRFVEGDTGPGPATVWIRLVVPVVAGESPSPAARVAAAADFGNGIAAALDFTRHVYINADLAVYLTRPAAGEWIALRGHTQVTPGAAGFTECELFDERGPIGRSIQTLWIDRR